ncbi:MAG: SelB C-terminal domain-containing protein, partial [Victivallales bacterium]|nr:SelB C-terminal domain-containing protein [Victivallales bacterium]
MHDVAVDEAPAGNRVALNLADLSTDDIHAGDFLAEPGLIAPTQAMDVRLTYLDTARTGKPLESGVRMHVAHGTKEVLGRVLLANGQEKLIPGESAYAQIRLEEPLPVSCGDRFVLRIYSPVSVAGGGVVLMVHPRLRTTLYADEKVLDALYEGNLSQACEAALDARMSPVTAEQLAHLFGVDKATVQECLLNLASAGCIKALGAGQAYFTTQATQARALLTIDEALQAFHAAQPSKTGIAKEELRNQCFPRMDGACFDLLLDEAKQEGSVSVVDGMVGLAAAQASAQQEEDQLADAIAGILEGYGITTPDVQHLAQEAKIDQKLVRHALGKLCDAGRAVRITNDWYVPAGALETCKAAVRKHLQAGGDGTMSGLKGPMGNLSRKYAVPLLEYFDAVGFTERRGDVRILRS